MILYDQRMEIPLNAGERALNRALGIEWIPYDKAVRPTVQDRQITFCGTNDHLEHDIEWDLLVISPERARPEAFIRTVESFSHAIKTLGPIDRTPNNLSKLKTLYNMARDNTRVRHLLSAGLRRPWEDVYRGDQRHALEYDRDFTAVLVEEYMQQRLIDVMQNERRPLRINELASALHEDERRVASCLMGMVSDGMLHFSHKEREAYYALNN